MSLKSKFKSDPSLAREGVTFKYEANSDGTVPEFKLARSHKQNKKYLKALRRIGEQKGDIESLSDEEQQKLLLDVFCETVLLGWSNFQPEDDGKAVPFTPDTAKAILGSEEWVDLYDDLATKASDAANFRFKALQAQAKN